MALPPLEPLRLRVRRAQLVVGLGFVALVLGSVLTAALAVRLSPRLVGMPGWVLVPVSLLVRRLWCLAVLPALAYGVGRVLPVRGWSTAVGALLAGEVFLTGVRYVQGGLAGLWAGWLDFALWGATLAGSVLLTRLAVERGRAAAERAQQEAQAKAEASRAQYAEFAREAERLAERHEARAQADSAAQAAEQGTVRP